MSATFVAVDAASLTEAGAKATRADRIVTAFEDGTCKPLLGFSPGTGRWACLSWCSVNPCGCWTVGADGTAQCREPKAEAIGVPRADGERPSAET